MNHDAQLQDELRRRLQEGLQQAQHGDVGALEHQPPVEVTAGPVPVPPALGAQVEGVDVPGDQRHKFEIVTNKRLDNPSKSSLVSQKWKTCNKKQL